MVQKETTISGLVMDFADTVRAYAPPIADHMTVCGERLKEFWVRAGADPGAISVIGQPRFDFYRHPERWPRELGYGESGPIALFLSYHVDHHHPSEGQGDPGLGDAARADRGGALEARPQRLAGARQAAPAAALAGRAPADPPPGRRPARTAACFLVDPLADARKLIAGCDVLVGFQSTAMIEAMLARKPVVYTGWDEEAKSLSAQLIPFAAWDDLIHVVPEREQLAVTVEAARGATLRRGPGRSCRGRSCAGYLGRDRRRRLRAHRGGGARGVEEWERRRSPQVERRREALAARRPARHALRDGAAARSGACAPRRRAAGALTAAATPRTAVVTVGTLPTPPARAFTLPHGLRSARGSMSTDFDRDEGLSAFDPHPASTDAPPVRYCKRCLMPETKPDLGIDAEGVCDACRSAEVKHEIDWDARARGAARDPRALQVQGRVELRLRHPRLRRQGLDLPGHEDPRARLPAADRHVVGVLVHRHRAPATSRACSSSASTTSSSRPTRRSTARSSPRPSGASATAAGPATSASSPIRSASPSTTRCRCSSTARTRSSSTAGRRAARNNPIIDRPWLEEFGGLLGNRIEDMLGVEGITESDLIPYRYPTDEELAEVGVTAIFLGYYQRWDAREQLEEVHGDRLPGQHHASPTSATASRTRRARTRTTRTSTASSSACTTT